MYVQLVNPSQELLYRRGSYVKSTIFINMCDGVKACGMGHGFKGGSTPLTATVSTTTCVNSPGHVRWYSATLDRLPCKHALDFPTGFQGGLLWTD